jgi:glycerol-3-phosphate cytidylyltransferase
MKIKKGIVAGNFDVIHPGYVKLFEDAKTNACNYLIVALHGDPTIERSHKCKPVQSVQEREYILKALRYVDEVKHYNTEKELLDLLLATEHDVRIIGSDYADRTFTGKEIGVDIYYHNRDHEYSLTDLKTRIAQQMKKGNKID